METKYTCEQLLHSENHYIGSTVIQVMTWDTYETDHYGKTVIAYVVREIPYNCEPEVIFEGADFCCAPCTAIDSPECLGSLMSFIALRPGDTDPDYFENYTERQLEFADCYGEELSYWAMQLSGELDDE